MLRDLTIQNYRVFKDFSVDGLARVNLIVGMNNSGKTSFLEAVHLLANQNNPSYLLDLLENRGEFAWPYSSRRDYQIAHIFSGHVPQPTYKLPAPGSVISIQSQRDRFLALEVWLNAVEVDAFPQTLPSEDQTVTEQTPFQLLFRYRGGSETLEDAQVRRLGVREDYSIRTTLLRSRPRADLHRLITTNSPSFADLAGLWDRITLTPEEDAVVAALQILEPGVERISFTSRQIANSGILVRLQGQRTPIPLGSMGEGMHRILALAMSAVTAQNSVLLVDEIDTGLYYRVQTDMWRLLIDTAQRLNVQIFATTHSWDCVAAFQEALGQQPSDDVGCLFRLQRRDDTIRAIQYDRDDLAIAVREGIEVR